MPIDAPNVTHVFIGEHEVAQKTVITWERNDCLSVYDRTEKRVEAFHKDDIDNFQFCFLERGDLRQSKLEGFVVMRVKTGSATESLFGHELPAGVPVIFAIFGGYPTFDHLNDMLTGFHKHSKVELLPFVRFPECVHAVLPRVPAFATVDMGVIQKALSECDVYISPPSVMLYEQCPMSAETLSLSSDDEGAMPPPPTYYTIEGIKMQISQAGISSLRPGAYVNDEIFDAAFKRLQAKHPDVYVFDTCATAKMANVFRNKTMVQINQMSKDECNRQFGSYYIKNGDKLPISQTFFSKRMLIFPICHLKHWILIVVINPLMADRMNANDSHRVLGYKAAAYYLDSLPLSRKYTPKLREHRQQETWNMVLPFLRLGAYHNYNTFIRPELLTISTQHNLPMQKNMYDCGPHAILNGSLVADLYDQLMTGPAGVLIDRETIVKVEGEASAFRDDFLIYLDDCRM